MAKARQKKAAVTAVPYSSIVGLGKKPPQAAAMPPGWTAGNVLGFFIVGFLLERPPGGGAARHTLKVTNLPKGTQDFKPWLMHVHYFFFDKATGKPVDRPLWIEFTD